MEESWDRKPFNLEEFKNIIETIRNSGNIKSVKMYMTLELFEVCLANDIKIPENTVIYF